MTIFNLSNSIQVQYLNCRTHQRYFKQIILKGKFPSVVTVKRTIVAQKTVKYTRQ